MKKFRTFALKKSNYKDMHLIIPHPFTLDLYDIVEEFNEFNNTIREGCLLIDLETIIGNREGKIVIVDIVNFKIKRSNIKNFYGSIDELKCFKIEYYSTLDKKFTQFLFPLALRKQVLKASI